MFFRSPDLITAQEFHVKFEKDGKFLLSCNLFLLNIKRKKKSLENLKITKTKQIVLGFSGLTPISSLPH